MERHLLISKVNPNYHCDRCSIELRHSVWKGYLVCLSLGKKKNRGFKCVRCVLSKITTGQGRISSLSRAKKQLVTEEELDSFVKTNRKNLTKAEDYTRCEII